MRLQFALSEADQTFDRSGAGFGHVRLSTSAEEPCTAISWPRLLEPPLDLNRGRSSVECGLSSSLITGFSVVVVLSRVFGRDDWMVGRSSVKIAAPTNYNGQDFPAGRRTRVPQMVQDASTTPPCREAFASRRKS